MNYNPKTLESLKSTWIGELLMLTNEEIETAMNELPDPEKEEKITTTSEEYGKITFPHLLGEMNDFERAINTLLIQKVARHNEICGKEREAGGDFSPEHNELHDLIPQLKEEMFRSIKKRFSDIPGSGLQTFQGGKIYAIEETENEGFPPFLKDLFGIGRSRMGIHVVEVNMS